MAGVDLKRSEEIEDWAIDKEELSVKGSKKINKKDKLITIKRNIAEVEENENVSLEAKEATYINRTSIAPRKIRNRIYENQKEFIDKPAITHTIIVCVSNIRPIAKGWRSWVNKIENIKTKGDIMIISEIQRIV